MPSPAWRASAFAVLETRTEKPLLQIGRLADRAIGGELFRMLAAAGSIFGLFLLCSVYVQNVLGTSPLMTGLAVIPLALAAGIGAHVGSLRRNCTAATSPSPRSFAPLIERGQKKGVFRSDLPVSWHLAVLRAIVHTASAELQSGRIADADVERAMYDRARGDRWAKAVSA